MDSLRVQRRLEVGTVDRNVHLPRASVVQPGRIAALEKVCDGKERSGGKKLDRWMSLQGGQCIWSPNATAQGEAMSSAAIKEQRQAVVLSSPVITPPAVYTGQ